MAGGVAQIVAGPMRLDGTDALVAVAETGYEDERGLTFVWVPGLSRWRMRPDVDPDEALGLIEWRRLRQERRTEGDDGG